MKNLFFKINPHTIRFRLLSGYILMVLLTALSLSTGTLLLGLQNSRSQAVAQLFSIAKIKGLEIQFWQDQLQGELSAALNEEYALERISSILVLEEKDRYSEYFTGAVRIRLNGYVLNSGVINEIFILNKNGVIILSTQKDNEGDTAENRLFFSEGLQKTTLELIIEEEQENIAEVIAAIPIFSLEGELLGVLAARTEIEPLADILTDATGMGNSGKTFLISADEEFLVSSVNDSKNSLDLIHSQGIPFSAEYPQDISNSTLYTGVTGARVVGIQQWIPEVHMFMILQQDLQEIFQNAKKTLLLNLLIGMVVLLIAVVVSLIMIQRIARPLDNLVQTTSLIAGGDLTQTARVEQADEIGSLAVSFNSMTAQLVGSINSLEQKVENRTEALKQRALQLETILKVSQDITSILNIEDLLNRIVRIIKESFFYYHVHIYLLDAETKFLHLQATSSEKSPDLKCIKINSSNYISRAAQTRTPVLLEHKNQDIFDLSDIGFSQYQSELAVPLDFDGVSIGALVIKTSQPELILKEDIPVLQTLADQITIAIENARLYKTSQQIAVLEERNRLARELHDSVTQSLYSLGLFIESWRLILNSGKQQDFMEFLDRSEAINQQALKEMRQLIHELRPPVLEKLGLWGALIQRLEMVEKRLGIDARIEIRDFIELPLDLEKDIFRITQEALNNALKHAQATHVVIRVKKQDNLLHLEVIDNGIGFDLQGLEHSGKMGLQIMQERALSIQADLVFQSKAGEGTVVHLSIPLYRLEAPPEEKENI